MKFRGLSPDLGAQLLLVVVFIVLASLLTGRPRQNQRPTTLHAPPHRHGAKKVEAHQAVSRLLLPLGIGMYIKDTPMTVCSEVVITTITTTIPNTTYHQHGRQLYRRRVDAGSHAGHCNRPWRLCSGPSRTRSVHPTRLGHLEEASR